MGSATQDRAAMAASKVWNEGAGDVFGPYNSAAGATATNQIQDPSASGIEVIVLAAATPVIKLPQPRAGARKILYVVQDGTGSRVASWATLGAGAVKWVGAAAPTLTTAAASVDRVSFESYDGVNWVGTASLHIA